MITMIVAVITVTAVIVTRMPQSFTSQPASLPQLPDAITLPEGVNAQAATFGEGWIAVVTDDNRILIYSPQGSLQQEIALLMR